MRAFLRLAVLSALVLGLPAASAQPSAKVVTFDDVLKQVKAGAPPADILEGCDTVFTLTDEQKGELVKAKAPTALVDALQVKRMKVADVTDFVVILDCSGSMKDEIGKGLTKMDAAKKVVGDLFDAVPNGRNLAFLVFGHDLALECQAVKVVRPLGPVNNQARKQLRAELNEIKAVGHTPIAGSLKAAGEVLAKGNGMSQVVVITDGVETCHGDPAAEAEALVRKYNERLRAVEVIGVGLTKEEKKAVADIARRGRGKFYDADSAAALRKSLEEAVPVKPDPVPVKVEPKLDQLTAVEKAMIKQLKDDAASVRKAAAESLKKRGNKAKEVVDALADRVADDLWQGPGPAGPSEESSAGNNSKDAALRALKVLAPKRVEDALVKAMDSKTKRVKEWATKAIEKLDK
jgi:Mg-chelatase subunit ChlD